MNSFKHFSGPKSIPPRRLFVIYKGLILIMKRCLKYTIIYSKVYDRGWKFTIFNTSVRSFAQNTRSQLKVYDHWRKVYDQIYLWLSLVIIRRPNLGRQCMIFNWKHTHTAFNRLRFSVNVYFCNLKIISQRGQFRIKIGVTWQLEIGSISNEGEGQFLIRIMVSLK